MRNPTRRNVPPLRKCKIPRAGRFHRPRIAESHVQEESIAQESRILTRGSRLPLGNCVISRSGPVHRSGIAESHAQERSTTQQLQNPTRSSSSSHTSSDNKLNLS